MVSINKWVRKLQDWKQAAQCWTVTKAKLTLKPPHTTLLAKWRRPQYIFYLNSKEYDTEQAKLEKDMKEIFYKNNCHRLNITIDDVLGECDLPSQDAIVVRKKVGDFILAIGKEVQKKKKKKKNSDQIVSAEFFFKLFYGFISIFLIFLFQYTCI